MRDKYVPAFGHSKASIIAVIRERFKGKSLSTTNFRYGDPAKPFCAYRGANGTKCAVGLYVPDGHAGCEFQGYVVDLLRMHEDLQEYMPFNDAEALVAFQQAHDGLSERIPVSEQVLDLIDWVERNVS